MDVATALSVLRPKTDSLRMTRSLSQDGQATAVDEVCTYFSKSPPHARQRYS